MEEGGAYSPIGKSHLLREMWIEIRYHYVIYRGLLSHLLREMWIEMPAILKKDPVWVESSPAGDVD